MADDTGRPEIFAVLGGSAVVGGIVIVAEKLSANDYWPLLWGGLLIVPGVYFLLASFNDDWPLYGRKALEAKMAAEREEKERLAANREEALHMLNLYVRSSFIAKTNPGLTFEQFSTWYAGLREFVIAAFGGHEESLITNNEVWSPDVSETCTMVHAAVASLTAKASSLKVSKDFNPELFRHPEWAERAAQGQPPFNQYFGPTPS